MWTNKLNESSPNSSYYLARTHGLINFRNVFVKAVNCIFLNCRLYLVEDWIGALASATQYFAPNPPQSECQLKPDLTLGLIVHLTNGSHTTEQTTELLNY